jgi:hypothetical protein
VVFVDGLPPVPPHLFGELVRTERGHERARDALPALFALCEGSVLERRAALLALGHFASSPHSSPFVRDIVGRMLASALGLQSYVLRGTLLTALSLCAVTREFVAAIRDRGLTLFKFGARGSVVPLDPALLLIPVTNAPPVIEASSEPPGPIGVAAAKLLNPIFRSVAMKELLATGKSRPAELTTVENVQFCHSLLANACFLTESRQFLFTVLHGAPLMAPDSAPVDARAEAECRARISEAQCLSDADTVRFVFSTIPIPEMALADVKAKKKGSLAPEAHLADADFEAAFQCGRDEFYKLPEEERNVRIATVFR